MPKSKSGIDQTFINRAKQLRRQFNLNPRSFAATIQPQLDALITTYLGEEGFDGDKVVLLMEKVLDVGFRKKSTGAGIFQQKGNHYEFATIIAGHLPSEIMSNLSNKITDVEKYLFGRFAEQAGLMFFMEPAVLTREEKPENYGIAPPPVAPSAELYSFPQEPLVAPGPTTQEVQAAALSSKDPLAVIREQKVAQQKAADEEMKRAEARRVHKATFASEMAGFDAVEDDRTVGRVEASQDAMRDRLADQERRGVQKAALADRVESLRGERGSLSARQEAAQKKSEETNRRLGRSPGKP